jgi:hypothetical protein
MAAQSPAKLSGHHIQIDQVPDPYEKFDRRIDGYTKSGDSLRQGEGRLTLSSPDTPQ